MTSVKQVWIVCTIFKILDDVTIFVHSAAILPNLLDEIEAHTKIRCTSPFTVIVPNQTKLIQSKPYQTNSIQTNIIQNQIKTIQ